MTKMLTEYTDVRLLEPYNYPGVSIPAGTIGTIIHAYQEFACYAVEFGDPYNYVETVPMQIVESLSGSR